MGCSPRTAIARRVLGPHVVLLVRHPPANHRGRRSLALGDPTLPPLPALPPIAPATAAAAPPLLVLGVALVLRPRRLRLALALKVRAEPSVHLDARRSVDGAGYGARVAAVAVHDPHLRRNTTRQRRTSGPGRFLGSACLTGVETASASTSSKVWRSLRKSTSASAASASPAARDSPPTRGLPGSVRLFTGRVYAR